MTFLAKVFDTFAIFMRRHCQILLCFDRSEPDICCSDVAPATRGLRTRTYGSQEVFSPAFERSSLLRARGCIRCALQAFLRAFVDDDAMSFLEVVKFQPEKGWTGW